MEWADASDLWVFCDTVNILRCLLVDVACFHLNVSLAAEMTSLNFVTSQQKRRNIHFPSKTSHQAINGSKSLSFEKNEHT